MKAVQPGNIRRHKEPKSMKGDITMKNLKGTKTETNLLEAFAGDSMARNKYTYFASQAKKDG